MKPLSQLFDFTVTTGGNFRLSEVLSISFGVQRANEFLCKLNESHPDVFGDLSFDYEDGRLVAGITPIGLVKLAMLLPLDNVEAKDAVWLATLRENVANYAIMYAATFQVEAEEEEVEEEEEEVEEEEEPGLWDDISPEDFKEMLESARGECCDSDGLLFDEDDDDLYYDTDEFEIVEEEFQTSNSLPFGLLITDDGEGNILEIIKQL